MCTAIKYKNNFYGRNLDLEYELPWTKVIIMPKNYLLKFKSNNENIDIRYSLIGMGMIANEYPLFYDAMNEKGLFMAGLYFKGYAKYFEKQNDKNNITPFEFIPYILGSCSSVDEAKKILQNVNIVDIPFSKEIPLTPLHWIICDDKQCIVVESTSDGLQIYDNPYKTLTNNPRFNFHLENMNNYVNISPDSRTNLFDSNIKIISNGVGTIGLPGSLTSQDRFVRAAFTNSVSTSNNNEEDISQFFHILDSVAQTRGTVHAHENKNELTVYSDCYDFNNKTLYYKTYSNNRLTAISLNNSYDKNKWTAYDLELKQDIKWVK